MFECRIQVPLQSTRQHFRAPFKSCTSFSNRYLQLFVSDQLTEGWLGPSTAVLDHMSGFEWLLLVDDDLLGVSVMAAAGNGLLRLKAVGLFVMAGPFHWFCNMLLNGIYSKS